MTRLPRRGGLPQVKARGLQPDRRTLLRDSATALRRFLPTGTAAAASFHFSSFPTAEHLSTDRANKSPILSAASLLIFPAETQTGRFLHVSSADLYSDDSTPTSAAPEREDIFPVA